MKVDLKVGDEQRARAQSVEGHWKRRKAVREQDAWMAGEDKGKKRRSVEESKEMEMKNKI